MESDLFSDANTFSLLSSQAQNITFLSNVFMMTFFTTLGVQGLRSLIGKPVS